MALPKKPMAPELEDRLIAEALREADIGIWIARWRPFVPLLLTVAAVLLLLAIAWFFRWQVTPVSNGDRTGSAYILDRWTGELYWADAFQRYRVVDEKP